MTQISKYYVIRKQLMFFGFPDWLELVLVPEPTRIMEVKPDQRTEGIVRQDLPRYVLQRNSVNFTIPDPEPTTVLGRLLVVLMKHTDRAGNRKWTLSALREALTNHGWLVTEDELRQAITHLLQTEHLEAVVVGNRTDYKFTGRDRVQIVDNSAQEAIA